MKVKKKTDLTVGEKLRKLRGKKTKSAVASDLGISRSAYVKYERNERTPGDVMKVKLAEYFGCSVASIFFE